MNSKIRKLGSDTLTYGLATVLGRFLNFLLTPMYSNLLHGKEYEFVIYIYTLFAFINVVYSLGMESAFFRFYSKDNPETSKKVFTHSFLMINIISIISTIIILFNTGIIADLLTDGTIAKAPYLIFISAFIPLLDAMMLIPLGFLRMTNQAKRFAIVRFVMIVIAVVLNYLFLNIMNLQAEGVIWSQIIASSLGVLYFLPVIYKNFISKYDSSLLIGMFKFGLPTLPANLSAIILQVADRPILTELTQSYQQVVTYQVNYRLGIPMMIFVTIFEYAWKPFYLSNYQDKDSKQLYARVFTYFTLTAAMLFLLVSLFVPYIVRVPGIGGKYFINPEYWHGISIIPIILVAYYFNGAFTNFSAGLLIEKKTSYLPLIVGVSALVNIISNFILIPVMGFEGAAWATFISYLISASFIYFISQKIFPVKYEWGRVSQIILISGIIFVLSRSISGFENIWFEIVIKISLICIFVISLYYFKFFNKSELSSLKSLISRKKT